MQKLLGPSAAAAARQLSSMSQAVTSAQSQRIALANAAREAHLDVLQLSELLSMRKRLLNDLPALRARLREPTSVANSVTGTFVQCHECTVHYC